MTFELQETAPYPTEFSSATPVTVEATYAASAAADVPDGIAAIELPPEGAAEQPTEIPAVALPRQRKVTPGKTPVKARKTLGSVLRNRRHELHLTQREVAAKLGVKPAHIAYLELDHRRPSLGLLNRIAELLDLDRERLILLSHPEARNFISPSRKPEEVMPKDQAWREFKRNKSVLNRYNVSKKEMRVLSQVALLGRVTAPRSFLFILNSIRQAVEDEEA
jgi:transcriptional regulator with XRE-family HTH domain